METLVDIAKRENLTVNPKMSDKEWKKVQLLVARPWAPKTKDFLWWQRYDHYKHGVSVQRDADLLKETIKTLKTQALPGVDIHNQAGHDVSVGQDDIFVHHDAWKRDSAGHRTSPILERMQIDLELTSPNIKDAFKKLDAFILKYHGSFKVTDVDEADRTDTVNLYLPIRITPKMMQELYEAIKDCLNSSHHDFLNGHEVKRNGEIIKGIKTATEPHYGKSALTPQQHIAIHERLMSDLGPIWGPRAIACDWSGLEQGNSLGMLAAKQEYLDLIYYLAGKEGKNPFSIDNQLGNPHQPPYIPLEFSDKETNTRTSAKGADSAHDSSYELVDSTSPATKGNKIEKTIGKPKEEKKASKQKHKKETINIAGKVYVIEPDGTFSRTDKVKKAGYKEPVEVTTYISEDGSIKKEWVHNKTLHRETISPTGEHHEFFSARGHKNLLMELDSAKKQLTPDHLSNIKREIAPVLLAIKDHQKEKLAKKEKQTELLSVLSAALAKKQAAEQKNPEMPKPMSTKETSSTTTVAPEDKITPEPKATPTVTEAAKPENKEPVTPEPKRPLYAPRYRVEPKNEAQKKSIRRILAAYGLTEEEARARENALFPPKSGEKGAEILSEKPSSEEKSFEILDEEKPSAEEKSFEILDEKPSSEGKSFEILDEVPAKKPSWLRRTFPWLANLAVGLSVGYLLRNGDVQKNKPSDFGENPPSTPVTEHVEQVSSQEAETVAPEATEEQQPTVEQETEQNIVQPEMAEEPKDEGHSSGSEPRGTRSKVASAKSEQVSFSVTIAGTAYEVNQDSLIELTAFRRRHTQVSGRRGPTLREFPRKVYVRASELGATPFHTAAALQGIQRGTTKLVLRNNELHMQAQQKMGSTTVNSDTILQASMRLNDPNVVPFADGKNAEVQYKMLTNGHIDTASRWPSAIPESMTRHKTPNGTEFYTYGGSFNR